MVQGISGKSLRVEPGAEMYRDMGSKGGDLCVVFADTEVRFLTGYHDSCALRLLRVWLLTSSYFSSTRKERPRFCPECLQSLIKENTQDARTLREQHVKLGTSPSNLRSEQGFPLS